MIITGLKKTYGDKTVLDVPSLEIEAGKIYAVTGHNGSGKSTLAKLIAGFYKDSDVRIDGKPVSKSGYRIAYMAQKSYAFNMSLEKNIRINQMGEADERIEKLMRALDIEHLRKQNAQKLSGGETQKMAIARLMVNDYDILLLDEPTSAMDAKSTVLAEGLIKEYVKKTNATVILITHEYDQTKRIAEEIIHLDCGKIDSR